MLPPSIAVVIVGVTVAVGTAPAPAAPLEKDTPLAVASAVTLLDAATITSPAAVTVEEETVASMIGEIVTFATDPAAASAPGEPPARERTSTTAMAEAELVAETSNPPPAVTVLNSTTARVVPAMVVVAFAPPPATAASATARAAVWELATLIADSSASIATAPAAVTVAIVMPAVTMLVISFLTKDTPIDTLTPNGETEAAIATAPVQVDITAESRAESETLAARIPSFTLPGRPSASWIVASIRVATRLAVEPPAPLADPATAPPATATDPANTVESIVTAFRAVCSRSPLALMLEPST